MKQYKGYYIDGVVFSSKKDIDIFLKNQAVSAYRKAVEYFANHSTMEASIYCDDKARNLVDNFGFTYQEVEDIEIETLKAIA